MNQQSSIEFFFIEILEQIYFRIRFYMDKGMIYTRSVQSKGLEITKKCIYIIII